MACIGFRIYVPTDRGESNMSIFKPINPDMIGYADRFECIKCGGWIPWPTYTKDIDEFNFCPYCGKPNVTDDPD